MLSVSGRSQNIVSYPKYVNCALTDKGQVFKKNLNFIYKLAREEHCLQPLQRNEIDFEVREVEKPNVNQLLL